MCCAACGRSVSGGRAEAGYLERKIVAVYSRFSLPVLGFLQCIGACGDALAVTHSCHWRHDHVWWALFHRWNHWWRF